MVGFVKWLFFVAVFAAGCSSSPVVMTGTLPESQAVCEAVNLGLLREVPVFVNREPLDYLGSEYLCAPLLPSPDGSLRVEEWVFSDGVKMIFAVREHDDRPFPVWLHGRLRVYDPCEYQDEIAADAPGYPVPDGWTPDDCNG